MVRCPVRSLTPPMEDAPNGLAFPIAGLEDLNALSSVHSVCRVSRSTTPLRL